MLSAAYKREFGALLDDLIATPALDFYTRLRARQLKWHLTEPVSQVAVTEAAPPLAA